MVLCCIDNILDENVYLELKNMFHINHDQFEKYTEHPGRTGLKIENQGIISIFNTKVKLKILDALHLDESLEHKLRVSMIYLCMDDVHFEIPYHYDDKYKYVSCVLYFGEGFSGTVFLKEYMKKELVEPKENRLVCFPSQNHIHCVPKSSKKRYTLQFHYTFA